MASSSSSSSDHDQDQFHSTPQPMPAVAIAYDYDYEQDEYENEYAHESKEGTSSSMRDSAHNMLSFNTHKVATSKSQLNNKNLFEPPARKLLEDDQEEMAVTMKAVEVQVGGKSVPSVV